MRFEPVTTANWHRLTRLFEARGGPRHCWCMVFRHMPASERRAGAPAKKAALRQRVEAGIPVGILAYNSDGEPIAWCSIAPLTSYHSIRTRQYSPDGTDDASVWSIGCFYIRSPYRRQGMTTRLAEAAIDYAASNGAAIVEAYPVPHDSPTYRYMGYLPTFESLGFHPVGKAGTRRHIMRLALPRRTDIVA